MPFEKTFEGMKVVIEDKEIVAYAKKLGMVDKTWTPSVEKLLKETVEDDPDSILEMLDPDVVMQYAQDELEMYTADDVSDDWSNLVDECSIEDYAREYLDMLTQDDLTDNWTEYVTEGDIIDYVSSNLNIEDVFNTDEIEESAMNTFMDSWWEHVGDDEILRYAKDNLDLMDEEEAKAWLKDLLDG